MSLVLRNLQRAVPIRRAPLRKKMEIVRSILGVQKFDLGIICVDNKNIQHINRIYREKNIPTDVLSFPFHENIKAGELPQPDFQDDYNLGDIFLGVEYIFQQCKGDEDYYDILTRCHYLQWRASPPGLGPSPPRPQLHVTATHGLCHLLGFTHSTEAEWQEVGAVLRASSTEGAVPHAPGAQEPGLPELSLQCTRRRSRFSRS
ncbi:endoribonuclease YbeY isoform X2 [Mirounga angustirostris]|uniref:endoribonuclease YbeY isoform X3 n=1 Tax=Mirounga leonina TaxID=9715 RepID=UPI00156C0179|nr:endoribonuclease YbeY isoform X3 [Mirounga leonina]XP_045758263.1 endoribonuclease YbeY isoform X3 [Mirounga angustirostris]